MLEPLSSLANLTTPLAMLAAGATIAQTNLLKTLRRPRIYFITALKLLAAPLVTYAAIFWIGGPQIAAMTVIIAAGCPAGAICTMLSLEYGMDAAYASEIFAVTTLLCCITLPALLIVLF